MKYRLTVRGMMGWVAITGIASAAFRVYPSLGCLVLGVLSLAALRTPMTVRGMMGLVAIAGVASAAYRVHPSLGCLVFGVLSLAVLRTPTAIDRLRADGASIRPWIAARVFLSSTLVALAIFQMSLLSVILIAIVLSEMFLHVDHPGLLEVLVFVVPSTLLALPIVVLLKRRLW